METFDPEELKELLIRKCQFKGIEFDSELIFDENKLNAAKGFWEVGLKDLLKNCRTLILS